jgi:hypothetical protein
MRGNLAVMRQEDRQIQSDATGSEAQLQRVAPKVSSPILEGRSSGIDASIEDLRVQNDINWPEGVFNGVIPALAVAAAAAWLSENLGVGVACGAVLYVAAQLHRFDKGTDATFAGGFLGYRPDTGWPRGVQEDEDFRWTWNGPKPEAPLS